MLRFIIGISGVLMLSAEPGVGLLLIVIAVFFMG
jgi:hypothetical protein